MFISSDYLSINYGVDDTIAVFFADREPPANNLYWKGKLLYLRPAPGYLFIPLIVDLLYKTGIDRQQLLSDNFVSVMEMMGHISALEETQQITAQEAIDKCAGYVKDNCSQSSYYHNLINFLNNKEDNLFSSLSTTFKALHRGDVFLFAVCALHFSEDLQEKIVRQWFALISTLLLLDDIDDIDSDRETGDENAFLESGLSNEGFQTITHLVSKNLQQISSVNRSMAAELRRQFKEMVEKPFIEKYANN